jgi:diacylglycerol O-acyltransferase / wax synthase
MTKHCEAWRICTPIEVFMSDCANPNNPSIITALFGFAQSQHVVNFEWVKNIFVPRLASHPRFRAIVQRSRVLGHPRFVPLPPSASLDHLVFEEQLPEHAQGTDVPVAKRAAAFSDRLDAIMSQDLPQDRPLWALHFFPDYFCGSADTCGATIVLRVHHVIGDGVALVHHCGTAVADEPPERPIPRRQQVCGRPHPGESVMSRVVRHGGEAIYVFLGTAIPDSPNVFNSSPLSGKKVLHCVPPCNVLSVDVLKAASKRVGCTLNDLLSAALTGAIREYSIRYKPEHSLHVRLHTAMAFNTHVLADNGLIDLSNRVIPIPMRQHVQLSDRKDRLRKSIEENNTMKSSAVPALANVAFELLALMPAKLRQTLWNRWFASVPRRSRSYDVLCSRSSLTAR